MGDQFIQYCEVVYQHRQSSAVALIRHCTSMAELVNYVRNRRSNRYTRQNYVDFSSDTLCSSSTLSSCLVDAAATSLADGCALFKGDSVSFGSVEAEQSAAMPDGADSTADVSASAAVDAATDSLRLEKRHHGCCSTIRLRCN